MSNPATLDLTWNLKFSQVVQKCLAEKYDWAISMKVVSVEKWSSTFRIAIPFNKKAGLLLKIQPNVA